MRARTNTLETLSARKLGRAYDRCLSDGLRISFRLARSGRGNEHPWTTLRKRDPLSQQATAHLKLWAELVREKERRYAFNGNLQPVFYS